MAINFGVTIELSNASTGVLESTVTSTGIITDAVSNILYPDLPALIGDTKANVVGTWLKNISPVGEILFGGLMLFSGNVVESATNIIPSVAVRESLVGYAGKGLSVSGNRYKGSWVSSVVDTDSVTNVWEFGAAEANGAISAVALTSSWGGDTAWKADVEGLHAAYTPINTSTSINDLDNTDVGNRRVGTSVVPFSGTDTAADGYSRGIGIMFRNGKMITGSSNSDKVLNVRIKSFTSSYNINSCLSNTLTNEHDHTDMTFDLSAANGTSYFHVCDGYDRLAYFSVSGGKLKGYELKYINDTMTMSELMTIAPPTDASFITPGTGRYKALALTDDYLYALMNMAVDDVDVTGLWRYTRGTGVWTNISSALNGLSYVMTGSNAGYIYFNLGTLWLMADRGYWLSADNTVFYPIDTTAYNSSGTSFLIPAIYDTALKPPYILCSDDRGVTSQTLRAWFACVLSAYLAAISNLSTPITKTSDQTMRVTCTLTST